MARKTKAQLKADLANKSLNPFIRDIIDSAQLKQDDNNLPTSDPGVAGSLFITGSSNSQLGGITGSGAYLLMVSQG